MWTSARSTLIVLLAIPISLVVTLIAMRLFGISLNIMSLHASQPRSIASTVSA